MDLSSLSYPDRKLDQQDNSSLMETPLGDTDKSPKIQLCLELREKPTKKRNQREYQLDVVVMKVKNIVQQDPPHNQKSLADSNSKKKTNKNTKLTTAAVTTTSSATPFVKITFDQGNQLQISELKKQADKENTNSFFFGEPFIFQILPQENSQKLLQLDGNNLHVEVCNKKVTRSAHCFGRVQISLNEIKLGKPIVKWYVLS